MNERRVKVSGMQRYQPRAMWRGRPTQREVPLLRLAGEWLAAAGFRVGGQVRIVVQRGQLVLTPVAAIGGELDEGKPLGGN
jgi:Toxin SymE, type I toxin-antitoxin system